MEKHFHTDAVHIVITAAGVFIVAHAARIAGAYMIQRGGRWATPGKLLGGFFSLPAGPVVAG